MATRTLACAHKPSSFTAPASKPNSLPSAAATISRSTASRALRRLGSRASAGRASRIRSPSRANRSRQAASRSPRRRLLVLAPGIRAPPPISSPPSSSTSSRQASSHNSSAGTASQPPSTARLSHLSTDTIATRLPRANMLSTPNPPSFASTNSASVAPAPPPSHLERPALRPIALPTLLSMALRQSSDNGIACVAYWTAPPTALSNTRVA